MNQKIMIYFSYEDEIVNENKKELGAIDISDFDISNRSLKVGMKFTNYINIIITDEIGNKENNVLLINIKIYLLIYKIQKIFKNINFLI